MLPAMPVRIFLRLQVSRNGNHCTVFAETIIRNHCAAFHIAGMVVLSIGQMHEQTTKI